MRSMLSVVLVSLMATAAPLHAQTGAHAAASAAPAPTAQQREAIARQDAQMSAAAARVAELIDAGKAGPSAASAYGVNYQLDSSYAPVARTVKGAAIDLGATER